jgi:hypothetical protein
MTRSTEQTYYFLNKSGNYLSSVEQLKIDSADELMHQNEQRFDAITVNKPLFHQSVEIAYHEQREVPLILE